MVPYPVRASVRGVVTEGTPIRLSSMIWTVKRFFPVAVAAVSLLAASLVAQQKPDKNAVKPMAGPRATALRQTPIYVAPDTTSQRVDRIQEGRELVVAESGGPWIRVFANTDIEEVDESGCADLWE